MNEDEDEEANDDGGDGGGGGGGCDCKRTGQAATAISLFHVVPRFHKSTTTTSPN